MAKKREKQLFIINHKTTKKQQAELDRLSVPLRYLPDSLIHITLTCPICRKVFKPDWFKKHELPLVPVKPKYEKRGVEYTGPARWILHHLSQKCPKCESDVIINLPVNKMKTRGSLSEMMPREIIKTRRYPFIHLLVLIKNCYMTLKIILMR